jgi:ketosteroid isomerase-like protein
MPTMADVVPIIETLENRWMRAWVGRDAKELKRLTARDFILLLGSKPAVILDQRSWLEAAAKRWHCRSFRFGDIHVRQLGSCAVFASQLELQAEMEGHDWSGRWWVTSLWRKRRIGRWRMVECILSRTEDNADAAAAVKSLQLWR